MSPATHAARCSAVPTGTVTGMRRIVLIDTASRLATRYLDRTGTHTMQMNDDTTAEDIEALRRGPGEPAFQTIVQYLTGAQQI